MHEQVSGAAKHVLIVDDDAGVRKGLEKLLRAAGMLVSCAAGGAEALLRLSQVTPDLVLLDISMPDIDGFEFLRRIRADAPTADLPVVMFSAKVDPALHGRALAAGASDHFVKMLPDLSSLPKRLMASMRG